MIGSMIWRGQATDSGTASRHRANVTTQAAGGAGARVCRALFADWAAVDPAGEAAAGDAVAGVLFDPLGAASDGAAGYDLLLR
jgi:hypothetical protein